VLNGKQSPIKKDQLEPEKQPSSAKRSTYHVPGYKDTHNMWEKIATLRSTNAPLNPIYVSNPAHKYGVSQSERMI
jgi:hypothetical protein